MIRQDASVYYESVAAVMGLGKTARILSQRKSRQQSDSPLCLPNLKSETAFQFVFNAPIQARLLERHSAMCSNVVEARLEHVIHLTLEVQQSG